MRLLNIGSFLLLLLCYACPLHLSGQNDKSLHGGGNILSGASLTGPEIECYVSEPIRGMEPGILRFEFYDGEAPYTIELEGGEERTETYNEAGGHEWEITQAGNYEISVEDALGASFVCSFTMEDVCEQLEYTICPGGSVVIGCLEEDALCYKWLPEETLDDPTALQPNASPDVTTVYTLHVTDENGEIVESYEATVNIAEGAETLITPANPAICGSGDIVELTASTWGDEDDFMYRWSTGATDAQITVNTPGTYEVTVTNLLTLCEATTSVEVIEEGLVLSIASSHDEICEGLEVTLTSSLIADTYTYEWSTGDASSSIDVTEAGLYSLTVTENNTYCSYIAEYDLNEKELAVTILPEVPLFCPSNPLELSTEGEYIDYEWSWGASSSTNTPALLVTTSLMEESGGEFSLSVMDADGCSATSTITVERASDPEAILDWLLNKGFYCIDIAIDDEVMRAENDGFNSIYSDPCGLDCEEAPCVKDDAGLTFKMAGVEVSDLASEVRQNLQYFQEEYGYSGGKAYITKNDDWCACDNASYAERIEGFFAEAEQSYWIHLYEAPDGGQDKFMILGNMPTMSSDEAGYFPDVDNRVPWMDAGLLDVAEDDNDGNTGSEANQMIYASMDLMLDNFIDADPFGTGVPEDCSEEESDDCNNYQLPLCNPTNMSGQIGLSPAGIPIVLSSESSGRFVAHESYIEECPTGALTGLTDFSIDDVDGKLLYYSGRVSSVGESEDDPLRFLGYRRLNFRGQVFNNDLPYWYSYEPEYESGPVTVVLGVVNPPYPETPESVTFQGVNFDRSAFEDHVTPIIYNENPFMPSNGHQGYGLILDGFSEEWLTPAPLIPTEGPISLDDIISINFLGLEPFPLANEEGVVYQVEIMTENGPQTEYIAFTSDEGVLTAYRWNCYTGLPEELEDFDLDQNILQQVQADVTLYTEPAVTLLPRYLGDPFCYYLTPEEAGPRPDLYPTANTDAVDQTGSIVNYAGHTDVEVIQNVIDAAADNYGCKLKIILSADIEDVNPMPTPTPFGPTSVVTTDFTGTPGTLFYSEELRSSDGDTNDAIFWIHYREDGSVGYCMRLAEDFFTYSLVTPQNAQDQEDLQISAAILEEMLIEQIRIALPSMVTPTEITDDVGYTLLEEECSIDEENCEYTPPNSDNSATPWRFGRRIDNPEPVNFLTVSKELVGLGKAFMKDLRIPEKLCQGTVANDATMFEIPEVMLGVGNKLVEENPFVSMVDLGKLAWSFVEKKEVRQQIAEIFLNPRKIAEAVYQAKVMAYNNDNPEVRLLESGKDGAAIFMALWNLPSLLNQLRNLGTKAKDLGNGITQRLNNHPKNVDLTDPGSTTFYRFFNDTSNPDNVILNWTKVEIDDFHKYMGEFPHSIQARFGESPWLIGMWKQFKDSGNFCNIIPGGFTNDSEGESRGPCVDFKAFVERLPSRTPAGGLGDDFHKKFEELFTGTMLDADGNTISDGIINAPDKVENLLADVNGNDNLFNYLKDNPNSLEAWEVASRHTDDIRLDTDFLGTLTQHLNDYPNLKPDLDDLDVFDAYKRISDDLEQSYEILDDVEGNLAVLIAQRTEGSAAQNFWVWIQRGRRFEEDLVLPAFTNRSSGEYLQLKNKVDEVFDVDLNQYDMYSQIQLKYNGNDYFVADQVYVKWVDDNGAQVISDVIIVENKLKSTTRLTTKQNAGKASVQLEVRTIASPPVSPVSGNALTNDYTITTNDKWLKVYDSEHGDVISGIDEF